MSKAFARFPAALPGAVVFDMDGLMLDTERLDRVLWREALEARGIGFPDELHASLVGLRETESDARLTAALGDPAIVASVRAEVDARWRVLAAGPGMPRKPGLVELLDWLAARDIPRAVATSTRDAKARLSLGPLAARFQALAFGDEVPRAKPAPDLYLLAAERLGVSPIDCLALEDSPRGLAAAEAAGMTTILIPDLVEPAAMPRFRCQSLLEVRDWLASGPGRGP
ncbi:MAG: HAD family phosphatase [Proteobacteria bacterium]|nr:HAD family phosphatase [Pseudomonadota bacterium]